MGDINVKDRALWMKCRGNAHESIRTLNQPITIPFKNTTFTT